MWESVVYASREILLVLNKAYALMDTFLRNPWSNLFFFITGIVIGNYYNGRESKRLKRIANIGIRLNEALHKGQQCEVIRDKKGDASALGYTYKGSGGIKISGTADVKFVSGKKEK